jgi:hydroxymethylpyrimidine pyrophosphatase-like HAD family hydrolase
VISQYAIEDIFDKYNPSTHYFELYTRDGVYVKKGLRDDLVDKHSEILQERITELSDIRSVMDKDIVKIIYISKDISIHDDLKTFEGVYSKKTIHPYLNPDTLSLITSPGVSKGSGVKYVAKKLSIELKDVLGVGDANSDWDFVKLCGHKAAMGNAENDLKQRVKNEGGIVGGDVNDDGLIDILRNYSPI